MSIKINNTQLVLLSAASQRDHCCLIPQTGPKRGQAQRAAAKLVEAGPVREIRAKSGAPIWRRDEESGHAYALKLTTAGATAIAVRGTLPSQGEEEPSVQSLVGDADAQLEPGSAQAATVRGPDSGVAGTPIPPRLGTKIAEVIGLLQRNQGAALTELVATVGWLPHTTRAALTGLRKRGYAIAIDRTDKARGSVYRIEPTETRSAGVARSDESGPIDDAPMDRLERRAISRSRRAA